MASVHPTAIVAPGAQLASTASIGPYAVIGAQVSIGEGSSVAAHCVIDGRTTIGRDNRIFAFCSLGAVPQDKKYAGEPTELRIGDRNTIREFCTLNLGTAQGGGVTSLGDDNWIMAYVHLAHDCRVGNQTIFANNASLAGHVEVGDWVILGGFTGVHQFTKIGAHAMTGMNTSLTQDLPPFVMASGNPASARGLNLEGLRRRGFSTERLSAIKRMQRLLYREGLSLEAAKAAIAALADERPQARDDIALMTDFLGRSTRGVLR